MIPFVISASIAMIAFIVLFIVKVFALVLLTWLVSLCVKYGKKLYAHKQVTWTELAMPSAGEMIIEKGGYQKVVFRRDIDFLKEGNKILLPFGVKVVRKNVDPFLETELGYTLLGRDDSRGEDCLEVKREEIKTYFFFMKKEEYVITSLYYQGVRIAQISPDPKNGTQTLTVYHENAQTRQLTINN